MRDLRLHWLLPVLLGAASAFADDWPCYRGAAQDGVVREKGLLLDWPAEGPKKLWAAPIGGGGNANRCHGGPVVVGGKVYVPGRIGSKDLVICIDVETGKEVWRCECESAGQIGFGCGARATPTVAGGDVFALGTFGNLLCIDAAAGAKRWERHLVSDFGGEVLKFGMSASPLADGDRVICEPGAKDAMAVALDRKTGKELWRSGGGGASYAPPQVVTIAGTRQILCFAACGAVALSPDDGKELWRIRYDCAKNIAAPLVDCDTLYLSNFDHGFTAFRVTRDGTGWKTEKLWSNAKDKAHTSAPVATPAGLCFYEWFASEGKIKCLDSKDGRLLWSLPSKCRGDEGNGALLRLDDGRVLANFSNGEVALFEVTAQAGTEKSRVRAVAQGSFAPACVADGRLYVRDSQNLACFDLRAKPAQP